MLKVSNYKWCKTTSAITNVNSRIQDRGQYNTERITGMPVWTDTETIMQISWQKTENTSLNQFLKIACSQAWNSTKRALTAMKNIKQMYEPELWQGHW